MLYVYDSKYVYIMYLTGDIIISKLKMYAFSPLHLHAITERLKLTEPTCCKFILFLNILNISICL